MVIRKYPKEIQELMKTYKPYVKCIQFGELESVLQEVVEVFEAVKKKWSTRPANFNKTAEWRLI